MAQGAHAYVGHIGCQGLHTVQVTQHAALSIGTVHSWSWLSIVVPVALHNSIFKTVCTGHVLILLAFVLHPCCVAFCALSSST